MGKIIWGHRQRTDETTQTQAARNAARPASPLRRQCSAGTAPCWCPAWAAGSSDWAGIRHEWSRPAMAGSSDAYQHRLSSYTAALRRDRNIVTRDLTWDWWPFVAFWETLQVFRAWLSVIKTQENNKWALIALKWSHREDVGWYSFKSSDITWT